MAKDRFVDDRLDDPWMTPEEQVRFRDAYDRLIAREHTPDDLQQLLELVEKSCKRRIKSGRKLPNETDRMIRANDLTKRKE